MSKALGAKGIRTDGKRGYSSEFGLRRTRSESMAIDDVLTHRGACNNSACDMIDHLSPYQGLIM